MTAKIAMVSLGCSKNQIDAEILLAKLQKGGYTLTGDISESDLVIVNTCGFIQPAKEEAIAEILELAALKAEGTIRGILVTGCLAQRYKEEILKELPEVDAVIGIGSNDRICALVEQVLSGERVSSFGEREQLPIEGERVLTTLPGYAYIKIAEGCDNCCSYCAIPMIRGRFRSRPMESILAEAAELASNGVKELILIAQDTTRYGEDLYGEYSLAKLLRALIKIEGLVWIRVLYCYPDKITDDLLRVMAEEPKIVKYLDIPLQHCSSQVLRAMNRGMDRVSLTALMEKIRQRIPGVTLRTTLIVGFPGETKAQFEELCEFVETVRFDRLGCFVYSPEEGTAAAAFEEQIDEDVKLRREEIVMTIQQEIALRHNEQKLSRRILVMTEGFDKYGDCYFGRSEADAPEIDGKVFFKSDTPLEIGEFAEVEITEVLEYDLLGRAGPGFISRT